MNMDVINKAVSKYGFTVLSVEFEPYAEVKVRWRRIGDVMEFYVTDYLQDMSDGQLASLLAHIARRIRDGPTDSGYPYAVLRYVESKKFRDANRDTYIMRSYHSTANTERLYDSYRRLIDEGIVEEIPDLVLAWKGLDLNIIPERWSASQLFKVGAVDRSVPKYDLDCAVAACALYMLLPRNTDRMTVKRTIREILSETRLAGSLDRVVPVCDPEDDEEW